MGYKWQGAVFFALLVSTYLAGMAMAEFRNVTPGEPVCLIGCCFTGGITMASVCATVHLSDGAEIDLYGYQLGCLYTSVASLLNSLLLLHVYAIASGRAEHEREMGQRACGDPKDFL